MLRAGKIAFVLRRSRLEENELMEITEKRAPKTDIGWRNGPNTELMEKLKMTIEQADLLRKYQQRRQCMERIFQDRHGSVLKTQSKNYTS